MHSHIAQYDPITLSCESAEYFNRALYPLINAFERKLRKLLYLTSSISGDEDVAKSINNLEKNTLGKIFDLLFTDPDFPKKVKHRSNCQGEFNGRSVYSKSEIQEYIDGLGESVLWDTLFSSQSTLTLKSNYRSILDFRNKVMHAHNLDKHEFAKAKRLFGKVNKELDVEIENHLVQVENAPAQVNKRVNRSIAETIAALAEYALQPPPKWIIDMQESIWKSAVLTPKFDDSSIIKQAEEYQQLLELYNSPDMQQAREFMELTASLPQIDFSQYEIELDPDDRSTEEENP